MSMFAPKTPTIAPPPPPPAEPDYATARALSEEAMAQQTKRRKGRGSTIVAGALGKSAPKTGTPTLMG